MEVRPKPILFLLGPSGSGKSTVGKWIKMDLGYLHIEIDHFGVDGIDIENLRVQWDEYVQNNRPSDLSAEIQRRTISAHDNGAIVTFSSVVVLSQEQIDSARQHGIFVAVLYATGADCVEAFIDRETDLNRGLEASHWATHNALSYASFSMPLYAPYRIMTFENGKRRERKDIVREIVQLTRRCS